MKPARMPHNSRNCADSGVVGSCTTQLRAEVGQRIRISAGVFFKLGDDAHVCSSRFVRFLSNSSSESRADKKCGSEDVNTELFTSPSNTVLVMYQSDNGTDGATFHISGKPGDIYRLLLLLYWLVVVDDCCILDYSVRLSPH